MCYFKKGALDARTKLETLPECGGGAGKEGSHGTEEESEGDLASAIILPWPRPPRMSSHLRHGDKVTEPLAAAATAGKHGESNSAKTTTRLILGETRQDKSLPLEAVAGFTASKPSHQSEDRANWTRTW